MEWKLKARKVEDVEVGCEDDQGEIDCVRGGWVVGRERAKRGGEGRGPRRSEEAIRGAQIASGGTIAAAHSSSSIAIISTSSWDILDDRTHTTNPTSYLSY